MSTQLQEPFHDPVDLLDELGAVIRAHDLLRRRVLALQARYAALEPYADRFDKPGSRIEWIPEEFGRLNVEWAARYLGDAAKDMTDTVKYGLGPAREYADKIRIYPQPATKAQASHDDWRRSQ
ncbi:hypothetical protein [Nocardia cyriacigeorgica]|uniref:hypothetical protein n=1 Tax=Nocardia cyriacigeorgica TaxID=135487 RepID=UPI003517B265